MNLKLSDFLILNKIGEGTHGKIYKAKYLPNNLIVSLKIMIIGGNEDDYQLENQIKYLKREISILKDINNTNDFHPNIIRYFGYFQENNNAYLVLEYIQGENLLDFSKRYFIMDQNLNENLIIIILKEIINGLIYLYEKKILHRNINPNNIMIDDNYNIKIVDFGISAYYKNNNNLNNQNQIDNLNNNSDRSIIRRPEYISPEMFYAYIKNERKAKYDFKTDIYSLGVTMFYLMTFKFPYEINNKERKKTDIFIDPNRYNPQLINIIMSMLEENQYIRPSCYDIFNELSYLNGQNNMKENNLIKLHNINLKENYLIKLSAFFSVMYSLCNISPIKFYFRNITIKKIVDNFKQKSPELAIVIDSFIEIIKELENQKCVINKKKAIMKFVENSCKKIIIFKECNKITPQIIIEKLFEYFYYNLSNLFIYNNLRAFKISEIIEKEKDKIFNPIIKQKVHEFKNKYTNIFGEIFYFITLYKIICPNCKNIIDEEANIQYNIEFSTSGNIKQLFEDFESEKYYSNTDKNRKICNKCGIMPLNFIYSQSIFSSPNTLILYFGNENIEIEEFIEIKESLNPNKKIHYVISSVIIKEKFINNYIYKVAIYNHNMNFWVYYIDDDSVALNFKEVLNKGIICIAFYKKDE